MVVSPDLILERAGCRLGESVLFGVFQAGIAYSDLKADCGGGAQHAKFPFADRIRAEIPRGWGYGLPVSTRRRSFFKA